MRRGKGREKERDGETKGGPYLDIHLVEVMPV